MPHRASRRPPLSRAWLDQNRSSLPAALACGPGTTWPERVVQFGEGNFLRGFADWMFDILNERGLFGGRVVVVPPTCRGRIEPLNRQDGLYTVLLRGTERARPREDRRVVTAVSRAIDAYRSWDDLVRTFCQPGIRFVVSNTTEAGIAFVDEPYRPGVCPDSFPAKVTSLLLERFRACQGHPASGLIFLPCELIERNGTTLRRMVLQHAEQWGLGAPFSAWVASANHFLDTLVDRIVAGYPRDEAESISEELGYDDELLTAAEWFHLWVIEATGQVTAELPFDRAGLNVTWTDDLEPYRRRKVRVLNGAHTASVLAAYHGGLDLVSEMMADPVFGRFVERALFDEVLPAASRGDAEWQPYAEAVLDRFRNRSIRHELVAISLNSVSKWRVRVLPTVLEQVEQRGSLPPLLTFSLAALLFFYRGRRSSASEIEGRRNGRPYPVRDEVAVLDALDQAWRAHDGHHQDPVLLAGEVLRRSELWGRDLTRIPGLASAVSTGLVSLLRDGARATVERLLA